MARCRSLSTYPWKNPMFIGVICALIGTYVLFDLEFYIWEKNVGVMFYLTMVVYLLAMWSYFTSAFMAPGVVPLYWGIYSEKVPGQRKYCLVCHNFKPERTHHCSKCQVCVLNMDHHCPWINNCVGFDNRKPFVLFITYLLIALIMAVVMMVIVLIKDFKLIFAHTAPFDFNMVVKLLLFSFYSAMSLTLIFFVHTNYKSLFHNSTTLEELILDKKVKDASYKLDSHRNQYDIDCYYNFTQVFGESPFFWFFPVHIEPLRGKGIYWDKNVSAFHESTNHNSQ